jgi:hypothetical protein
MESIKLSLLRGLLAALLCSVLTSCATQASSPPTPKAAPAQKPKTSQAAAVQAAAPAAPAAPAKSHDELVQEHYDELRKAKKYPEIAELLASETEPEFQALAGKWYVWLGEYEKAETAFSKASPEDPKAQIALAMGTSGNVVLARTFAERSKDPAETKRRIAKGIMYGYSYPDLDSLDREAALGFLLEAAPVKADENFLSTLAGYIVKEKFRADPGFGRTSEKVLSLAFSEEERSFAMLREDGAIHWAYFIGEGPYEIKAEPDSPFLCCSPSPDGHYLYALREGLVAKYLPMTSRKLLEAKVEGLGKSRWAFSFSEKGQPKLLIAAEGRLLVVDPEAGKIDRSLDLAVDSIARYYPKEGLVYARSGKTFSLIDLASLSVKLRQELPIDGPASPGRPGVLFFAHPDNGYIARLDASGAVTELAPSVKEDFAPLRSICTSAAGDRILLCKEDRYSSSLQLFDVATKKSISWKSCDSDRDMYWSRGGSYCVYFDRHDSLHRSYDIFSDHRERTRPLIESLASKLEPTELGLAADRLAELLYCGIDEVAVERLYAASGRPPVEYYKTMGDEMASAGWFLKEQAGKKASPIGEGVPSWYPFFSKAVEYYSKSGAKESLAGFRSKVLAEEGIKGAIAAYEGAGRDPGPLYIDNALKIIREGGQRADGSKMLESLAKIGDPSVLAEGIPLLAAALRDAGWKDAEFYLARAVSSGSSLNAPAARAAGDFFLAEAGKSSGQGKVESLKAAVDLYEMAKYGPGMIAAADALLSVGEAYYAEELYVKIRDPARFRKLGDAMRASGRLEEAIRWYAEGGIKEPLAELAAKAESSGSVDAAASAYLALGDKKSVERIADAEYDRAEWEKAASHYAFAQSKSAQAKDAAQRLGDAKKADASREASRAAFRDWISFFAEYGGFERSFIEDWNGGKYSVKEYRSLKGGSGDAALAVAYFPLAQFERSLSALRPAPTAAKLAELAKFLDAEQARLLFPEQDPQSWYWLRNSAEGNPEYREETARRYNVAATRAALALQLLKTK